MIVMTALRRQSALAIAFMRLTPSRSERGSEAYGEAGLALGCLWLSQKSRRRHGT